MVWRVSRGETLYRDVAWAYGPLPAPVLAAALRCLGPDAGGRQVAGRVGPVAFALMNTDSTDKM